MNWKLPLLAILIIGGIVAGVAALGTKDSSTDRAITTQAPTTEQKAFTQIQSAIANGGQLVDVRTPEEFAAGHIKAAVNLSLTDIQAGKYPEMDKTKPLYVYCRSGNRSAQATTILRNAGYTNITDLGAMTEVADMGGEVTQ